MIRRGLGQSALIPGRPVSFRAASFDSSGQHYHTWNDHYSRSRIGYLNSPDRKVGYPIGICWADIKYCNKQQDNCDIYNPGSAGHSTEGPVELRCFDHSANCGVLQRNFHALGVVLSDVSGKLASAVGSIVCWLVVVRNMSHWWMDPEPDVCAIHRNHEDV